MAEISLRQGASLFRRLAVGYRAGLDLRRLWEQETRRAAPLLAQRSKLVLQQIAAGATLAEAMAGARGFFSPLAIAVVRAGEAGGRLEQSFLKLAEHFENWIRFRAQVIARLRWPLFQLGAAIVIFGGLILVMGWAMSMVGRREEVDWFGWGWGTQAYLRAYVAAVVLAIGGAIAAYQAVVRGWLGPWPARIVSYLPVVGPLLRHLALARFCWASGVTLGAGMEVSASLRMGIDAAQYPPFQAAVDRLEARVRAGDPIHQALRDSGAFDDELLTFVENGETAGQLPETLDHLSRDYQERVENELKLLATLVGTGIYVLIALILIAAIFFLFDRLILSVYRAVGI